MVDHNKVVHLRYIIESLQKIYISTSGKTYEIYIGHYSSIRKFNGFWTSPNYPLG